MQAKHFGISKNIAAAEAELSDLREQLLRIHSEVSAAATHKVEASGEASKESGSDSDQDVEALKAELCDVEEQLSNARYTLAFTQDQLAASEEAQAKAQEAAAAAQDEYGVLAAEVRDDGVSSTESGTGVRRVL